MQSLADVLKSLEPKPTHALFLAFDASPPFFDHEILPAILNDGLTDVTIIVDALALNASTIDSGSTRKAGISYRIASVRAIGGGKFHPKLVLLMHDSGAHALIGSANLTWSGWCRNVEVMDVLTFGARGAYFGQVDHPFRSKAISPFAPTRSRGSADGDQSSVGHGISSWVMTWSWSERLSEQRSPWIPSRGAIGGASRRRA